MHISLLCDRDHLAISVFSSFCATPTFFWAFLRCSYTYRQLSYPVKISFMQFASVCQSMFRSSDAQSTLPLLIWSLRLWGVGFVQARCYPSHSSSIPKLPAHEMSRVSAMYRTIAYTASSTMTFFTVYPFLVTIREYLPFDPTPTKGSLLLPEKSSPSKNTCPAWCTPWCNWL